MIACRLSYQISLLNFLFNDEFVYDTIRALDFIKAIELCPALFTKGLLSFQKNAPRVER